MRNTIWLPFLSLRQEFHLQWGHRNNASGLDQDPSPVTKASLKGEIECHRRENNESERVLLEGSIEKRKH